MYNNMYVSSRVYPHKSWYKVAVCIYHHVFIYSHLVPISHVDKVEGEIWSSPTCARDRQ